MSLDTQWFVDQTFEVALDEMESLHILTGDTIIRCMQALHHTELLAHQITAKTDGRKAAVIEYIAIDLVFIDALGKQLADNK